MEGSKNLVRCSFDSSKVDNLKTCCWSASCFWAASNWSRCNTAGILYLSGIGGLWRSDNGMSTAGIWWSRVVEYLVWGNSTWLEVYPVEWTGNVRMPVRITVVHREFSDPELPWVLRSRTTRLSTHIDRYIIYENTTPYSNHNEKSL